MSEVWGRLPPEVRDRIDVHLRHRRLIQAIVALRGEGGLDPVPGLFEAQDVLAERSTWLGQQGLLEPVPPVEVPRLIVAAQAIGAPVAAIEAVWDGDSVGWFVDLVAVVRRPGPQHREYAEEHLAAIRHGGDIRLFNGRVPPWPEAAEADRIGTAVATHLGVPFHFTDPDTPDVDLPRWWDLHAPGS